MCRLVSWLDGWCAVAQSFFESRSQGMTMRFIFIATLLLAGAISVLLWRHWELTILFKETGIETGSQNTATEAHLPTTHTYTLSLPAFCGV